MEIALWVLRALFFLVAIGLAVAQTSSGQPDQNWLVIFLFYGIGALLVIAADVLIRRKRIDLISSVYFGLVVGLFLTYVMTLALTPLFEQFALKQGTINWQALIVSFLGTSLSYLCISLLWQTRDDFRFVIPYVEFAKDLKGAKPFILDTSVVIDGRIADIVETAVPGKALARLGRRAAARGRTVRSLVEVDFTGERSGVPPDGVLTACDEVASTDGLRLVGLMTLPPLTPTAEEARPYFVRLRELLGQVSSHHPDAAELSMGMSLDYQVAVEEGATMVRIGTALFGERPPTG